MSRADQVRGKLLLTLAVSGLLVVACTRDTSSTRSATRDVRVETAETRVTPESPPIVDPSITPVRRPLRSIAAEPVLALGLGDVFSPSFTPAGDAVLFHTGREHSPLMRATFDRTGRPALATVLRDGASNYHVTASPDGQWLAFDSDPDGIRRVYVAHAGASDPRKVSGEAECPACRQLSEHPPAYVESRPAQFGGQAVDLFTTMATLQSSSPCTNQPAS